VSLESEDDLDSIVANCNDVAMMNALKNLAEDASEEDSDAATLEVKVELNPQKLWDAISTHAKGPIIDLFGKDFHGEMMGLGFPTSGTYTQRSTQFITSLRHLLEQAERINQTTQSRRRCYARSFST
jgi:hypothetical protein